MQIAVDGVHGPPRDRDEALRVPQAAVAAGWTWLILAAYTHLRLTRGLAADLRRPWEKPLTPTG